MDFNIFNNRGICLFPMEQIKKYRIMKLFFISIILILLSSFALGAVEDAFNRSDGSVGTATNGNAWVVDTTGGDFDVVDELGFLDSDGNTGNVLSGSLLLEDTNPSRIDFVLNESVLDGTGNFNYFYLADSVFATQNPQIFCNSNVAGYFKCHDGASWVSTGFTYILNVPFNVSFRNIDYVNYEFDVYIDNVLKYTDMGFYSDHANGNYFNMKVLKYDHTIDCITTNGDTCEEVIPLAIITLTNAETTNAINTFNATVNGTLYQTTNGTITTPYYVNTTTIVNISINANGFYSVNFTNYNISADLDTSVFKYRTIELNDSYNSSAINTFNATINTDFYSTSNGTIYLSELENHTTNASGTISAENYFDYTLNSTSAENNFSLTLIPYTKVFLKRGASYVSNFTIEWLNFSGGNGSYTTTNGVAYIPIYNGTFQLNLTNASDGSGFDFSIETVNVTAAAYLENYTITAREANSLQIYIYDATFGGLVDELVSFTVTSNVSVYANNTLNGTFYYQNMTPATYLVSFNSDNFSNTDYSITISDGYAHNLNVYLSRGSEDVVFTVKDKYTSGIIESATVSIEKVVGAAWVVIGSLSTDVTGRIQYTYEPSAAYRFTISKSGYEDKTFTLDPIIFDSYDVFLIPTVTDTDPSDFAGVSVVKTLPQFANGLNNISFRFISPSGIFTFYSLNVSYDGGSNYTSDVNAYGGNLDLTLNISGANFGDFVTIVYTYNVPASGLKTFTEYYEIVGEIGNMTIGGQKNQDYGLGELEKSLIGTGAVIITVGIATLYAGMFAGAIIGLFVMAIMHIQGFIPLWAFIISMVMVVMLIIWRVGNNG